MIDDQAITSRRIDSPDEIMVVGSARAMEDVAWIAYSQLVFWPKADYGFDRLDAYQLLSQAGRCYVGNMVDTLYSLVVGCPKRYLDGLD